MNKKTLLPYMLTLLAVIFWGANFNVGKILVEHLSPINLAAMRFLLSVLCLIPLVLLIESRTALWNSIQQNLWIYILLGLVGIVGYNGFFFIGLKQSTAINAALIMATNPPLTMLLAALFLKERLSIFQQTGALISLFSVGIVITKGNLSELLHLQISVGDLIIMLANICWALYNVLIRRYLHNRGTPLVNTTLTMLMGTVMLMTLSGDHVKTVQTLLVQDWEIYSALIYMVIFGTVAAYLFWNYGISQLGTGKTSIFFNLMPVVTSVIAVCMGDTIASMQIMGGLGVIFGVLLSTNAIRVPLRLKKRVVIN